MNFKLFVCIPCYQESININCVKQLLLLSHILIQNKIEMELFSIDFESLIPRARNACGCKFLNTDNTHLLFIDGDIIFNPYDVLKLIYANKDVIGATYPKKKLDYNLIKSSQHNSLNEMISKSVYYSHNIKTHPNIGSNIIKVDYIATGFLLIKRHVFLKLINSFPDIKYTNDIQAYKECEFKDHMFDFFPSKIIDGKYLSEDYGFCYLWKQLNGDLFIDTSINLTHIGNFHYVGNYQEKLKR